MKLAILSLPLLSFAQNDGSWGNNFNNQVRRNQYNNNGQGQWNNNNRQWGNSGQGQWNNNNRQWGNSGQGQWNGQMTEWNCNTHYTPGQRVVYQGTTYEVILDHVSITSQIPCDNSVYYRVC